MGNVEIMKLKKMRQVSIRANMTVNELLSEMKEGGFTCRKVAVATDLFEEMINDIECRTFLGLAGALIPGGMRKIIKTMIEEEMVDCIVTTGANISHDLMETSGGSHYHGNEQIDDSKLKEMEVSRIFSTLVPYEAFVKFEELMQKVLQTIPNRQMSTREFIHELGKHLEDKNSFVRAAYEKEIPIFSPSFATTNLEFNSYSLTP